MSVDGVMLAGGDGSTGDRERHIYIYNSVREWRSRLVRSRVFIQFLPTPSKNRPSRIVSSFSDNPHI
jgi:hypothetical protein